VKKMILLVVICAVLAMSALAEAGTRVRDSRAHSRSTQVPFYWHPFFYPGPFAYGYPGGLNYAFPGPYVSPRSGPSYSYGYPGPYNYGTWEYSSPNCFAKPDGRWLCG
jgi:hypothetical protein